MLVGVAFLPLSFPPSGIQAFYITNRPNCKNICNTVQLLLCSGTPVAFLSGLLPINQFKRDQKTKQQALRTYCPKIYTGVVIHLPTYLFCDILSQGVLKARKNTKISGAAAADGRPTAWTVKVFQKTIIHIEVEVSFFVMFSHKKCQNTTFLVDIQILP